MNLQNVFTYHIQIEGQMDLEAFNTGSPHWVEVLSADAFITVLSVCADQAGLVGLLRRLHQQGFALLCVRRV